MAAFFPKIVDKYVRIGGIVAALGAVVGVAAYSYLTLPEVVKAGYQPVQPVPYSHKLAEYVYFNHSAHVNSGVSCVSCHGRVDQMPEVRQAKPLNMAWCLDCHRNPAPNLRPVQYVTKLDWTPTNGEDPAVIGRRIIAE